MKKRRNKRPEVTISPVSIIALVLGIGMFVGLYMLMNPGKPGEYVHYRNPLLPLTSLSGGEAVEVQRDITLDFWPYGREEYRHEDWIHVTDTYRLTNTSGSDAELELVWSTLGTLDQSPVITVDGAMTEATLCPAADREEQAWNASSFRKFAQVLTENDFLAEALAEAPEWDVPVKVYHFYDLAYTGEELYGEPYLTVDVTLGKSTNLWARTFDWIQGEEKLMFAVDRGEAWLYVLGDDLEDLQTGGNRGINVGANTAIQGVTYELETYESTFMECLWEAAQAYVPYEAEELILATPEMLYAGAMKQIVGSSDQEPGGIRSMDTRFYQVYHDGRMLYWVFPVEIPAGETVEVSVQFRHKPSENSNGLLHGYDIATSLCSNLNFTGLRVSVVNEGLMVLDTEQNMGLDPSEGITTVELDPKQERYYIGIMPPQ